MADEKKKVVIFASPKYWAPEHSQTKKSRKKLWLMSKSCKDYIPYVNKAEKSGCCWLYRVWDCMSGLEGQMSRIIPGCDPWWPWARKEYQSAVLPGNMLSWRCTLEILCECPASPRAIILWGVGGVGSFIEMLVCSTLQTFVEAWMATISLEPGNSVHVCRLVGGGFHWRLTCLASDNIFGLLPVSQTLLRERTD